MAKGRRAIHELPLQDCRIAPTKQNGGNKMKNKKNKEGQTTGKARGKLSLCMIVKNEEKELPLCVNSVKPALDEIVIVDTGSSDNTKEVARQLGARVFDFPWVDDFSAARNHSILRATGDYILWLDADDRVDEGEVEKIRLLKQNFPWKKNQAYYLTVNSQSPADGAPSAGDWL